MNKKIVFLFPLLLVSCGNPTSSNSSVETSTETPSVEKIDLSKVDEVDARFDNPLDLEAAIGINEQADPFILRYNGKYYLYSTGANYSIRCYVSEDLVNWELCDNGMDKPGVCYDGQRDRNYDRSCDAYPYAPEVIYHDGFFYMTTSITGNGHFMLVSEYPEGPYEIFTGNLQRNIDGHFFIDNNEKMYFYICNGGKGLAMFPLNYDFKTFGEQINISNIDMGSWTEGPYMIQRDGNYYFTYCGQGYTHSDYRIEYDFIKGDKDITKNENYSRREVLACATDSDEKFDGLGHSMNVLGPDMDSYYLCYHVLDYPGAVRRYLCLSRLYFSEGDLVAQDVKKGGTACPKLPAFASEGLENFTENGNYFLSNKTDEEFTVEFNTIGNGKMIFSFVDNQNYSYLTFDGKKIDIHKVTTGDDTVVYSTNLVMEYSMIFNHTFRLSYKDGKLDLNFDGIELENDIELTFEAGSIGYEKDNSFVDIGYTAFSNSGQGSSDSKEYKSDVVLANSYDEKLSKFSSDSGLYEETRNDIYVSQYGNYFKLSGNGDFLTYRIYAETGDEYYLNMRVTSDSQGKKIGYRIDGGELNIVEISDQNVTYKNGDIYLNIDSLILEEGNHNITFESVGDTVKFNRFKLDRIVYYGDFEYDFMSELLDPGNSNQKSLKLGEGQKGLVPSDIGSLSAVISKGSFNDYEINGTFKVNDFGEGSIGFVLNVTNFSYVRSGYRSDMYQGIRILFSSDGKCSVTNINYNLNNIELAKFDYRKTTGDYNVNILKSSNEITILLNDEFVGSICTNVSNLCGRVAMISQGADVVYKSISVISD